jgi:hypothetical protein
VPQLRWRPSLLILVFDRRTKRPQVAKEWSGTLSLTSDVATFYAAVGPVDLNIPGYGNDYFMPSLAGLWNLQEGYRWHGRSRAPLAGWDDDWLVVAYEGGDPFILCRRSGGILHAVHGQGDWEASEMFGDLLSMAACMAIMGIVVADAGENLTNAKGYIRAAHRQHVEADLRRVLGSDLPVDNILGELGWG